MRILFTIGSLSGGGAERVVARLASQMAKEGHEIYIALIASNREDYDVDAAVRTYFVDTKINIRGLRHINRLFNYRKYVKHINPDVVVSFTVAVNLFVLDALKGMKVKTVVSERNNPYVDPPQKQIREKRDRLYRQADGYVFQTEDAKNYFTKEIQEKGTIIINPIGGNIPEAFTGEREKRIVTVGRLEPQKNHKLLIDAFQLITDKNPEYTLEIYGTGTLEQELHQYIADTGLNEKIVLKGHDTNVLEHIKTASIFVLSSDYEGMSNALLEAMALGLPVISTDHPIGGAKMLICNGVNGVLVPVGDAVKLAEAMESVISNPQKSAELAKEATKVLIEASLPHVSEKWIDYIKSIL